METLVASPASVSRAIEVLTHGGIVMHATETCYGMTCDLRNSDAVAKLFAIKKRPLNQPVSALFASVEQAQQYLVFNDAALQLAKKYLPGPLTIILPLASTAPTPLFTTPLSHHPTIQPSNHQASVGLRISSHSIAAAIAHAAGFPVSTTSANIHGHPEAYSIDDFVSQLDDGEKPDLLLDSGKLPSMPPSTIVEMTGDAIRVVRQGSLRIG